LLKIPACTASAAKAQAHLEVTSSCPSASIPNMMPMFEDNGVHQALKKGYFVANLSDVTKISLATRRM
jgi:hypothetical protein